MKIKVFLILLAFASSAFAQITCPNDTTVGKFINPHKNMLNLENLEYVCEDMEADLPQAVELIEYDEDLEPSSPNARYAKAYLVISTSVADTQTITVGSQVFELDTNSSVTGGRTAINVAGNTANVSSFCNIISGAIGQATSLGSPGLTFYWVDTSCYIAVTHSGGAAGNSIAVAETLANGQFLDHYDGGDATLVLSGGANGVAGESNKIISWEDETNDASPTVWISIGTSTTSTTNWKRLHLYPTSGDTETDVQMVSSGSTRISAGDGYRSRATGSSDVAVQSTSALFGYSGEIELTGNLVIDDSILVACGNTPGALAFNSTDGLCVCDGTDFVKVGDYSTECTNF